MLTHAPLIIQASRDRRAGWRSDRRADRTGRQLADTSGHRAARQETGGRENDVCKCRLFI